MGRVWTYLLGATALLGLSSVASAATLLDQTNLPMQGGSSVALTFTAGSGTTTVDFAGYDLPSWINVYDISLTQSGDSTNLLGQNFNFAAAASGSDAYQYGPGTFGTSNLGFGGVSAGYYDDFSQTVSTLAGSSYTLSFTLSSYGTPNALKVSASEAVAGVPEPATWAMMLLGFGALGVALRRSRRTAEVRQFA